MDALLVKLGEQHVAIATNRGYRGHLWRLGPMIPVAGGAVRSGQIALLQCRPVDAATVVFQLVRRDAVLSHSLRVGVATPAGVGQARWIYESERVLHGVDIV